MTRNDDERVDSHRLSYDNVKTSRCRGCDRSYSVPGYVRKTEIGCHEGYAATGETAQQAWCAETKMYV